MPSTSSWRSTRTLPAPSAARIDISRRRATARASWRLATFAVAVTSSRPTAISSTISGRRTSAPSASRIGRAVISMGPSLPKIARVVIPVSAANRPRAVPSAAACAGLTPGPSTATALKSDRELPAADRTANGTNARAWRSGKACASGSTPTIVWAWPSSWMDLPRTPRSAPNRSRHRRSDRTATAAVSSFGSKNVPSNGRTPSTENRLAVPAVTRMRSASPAPVIVTRRCDHAATCSMVAASSRHAR